MLAYMTAKDAAEKWNISRRRVNTLCQENRIPNIAMLGNMWIIPIEQQSRLTLEPHDMTKRILQSLLLNGQEVRDSFFRQSESFTRRRWVQKSASIVSQW